MRVLPPEKFNRICACGNPAKWMDTSKEPVCDRCKRCEEILGQTARETCGKKRRMGCEEYDDSCKRRTGASWRIMN